MRIAVSRFIVVLAAIGLGISAAAEAGPLSGHVRDQSGTPIVGATVEVLDPNTFDTLASGTTDSSGAYSIDIADGTYSVFVSAPPSSDIPPAFLENIVVSGPTTLDVVLQSPTATTFSGRVLDLAGAGIPGQSVRLIPEGGEIGMFATTDASGGFSFNTQTGSYFVVVNGDNRGFTVESPQFYSVQTEPFEVSGNATVDFTLPVRRVTVHVQNGQGAPVAGATLSSSNALNCELTFGGMTACGASNYDDSSSPNATTDSSGNVTLFLFPTPVQNPDSRYSFTATPPAGSSYAAGSVSGIEVINDTTVTIVLNAPTVVTGRLLDGLGAGIANQVLELVADGAQSGVGTTTGADGAFSFSVDPGLYRLNAFGDNQASTASAPGSYSLNSEPFSVADGQTIDFQLPVVRVDVRVVDSAGNPVPDVRLSTTAVNKCGLSFGPATACGASSYPFSDSSVTDSSGDITLWLFPTPPATPDPSSSYRFTATPPNGSGLATTTVSGIRFSANTALTIELVAPVTVTGRLVDRANIGVPNQFLEFVEETSGAATGVSTDAAGNYSAEIQPGTYRLNATGDNQNFVAAAPQFYALNTGTFSVTDDQVINLALPAKRLQVHVQDSAGNPIANVGLSAFGPINCALTFGPATACGFSQYFYNRPGPGEPAPPVGVTNASGDLTLWLFATPPGDPDNYNLSATPLADSGFEQLNVSGVTLTDDATLVMVLNASHAAPVTTLQISPPANADGTYPDPATITLSATAAPGFSVDTIFYDVDNTGAQQYAGPFDVAGAGPHSIRYFSVDDEGVAETPQTFNFTLAQSDVTPPVTTATVSPSANAAGWHRENVTVGLTAADEADGSGVQSLTYEISGAQATPATVVSGNSATISITAEGTSIITFWATDNAGNNETAQTVTVNLDKTVPTITGAASPAPNANGWNNTAVTVTFTCADGPSGLAPGSPPSPTILSTEGTGQSATGTCEDLAGNSASATVSNINIDLTVPEAYFQFNPATKDIVVFGRDSLSGVPAGPIAPSSVVPVSAFEQLRTYDVTDQAGNVLQLVIRVHKRGQLLGVRVVSTKYGDAAPAMAAFNLQTYSWTQRPDGTVRNLDQVLYAGSSLVQAEYVAGSNRTTITKWLPAPVVREVRTGLVLLRLATAQGHLTIEY